MLLGNKLADFNTKDNVVFNTILNTYIPNMGDYNITFVKDVNKLMVQYQNLIKSVGKKYSKYCHSYDDKKELFSFILECFVTLVIEFSMSNTMDFQGFISRMLNLRVRGSFISKKKRQSLRESTIKTGSMTVSDMIDIKMLEDKIYLESTYRKKPNVDDYHSEVVTYKGQKELDDSIISLKEQLQESYHFNAIINNLVDLLSKGYSKEYCINCLSKVYKKCLVEENYKILKNDLSKIYNIKS